MIYRGVLVTLQLGITEAEAAVYLDQEFDSLEQELGELALIDIFDSPDVGDHVILKGHSKSQIRRIRRITGYLAEDKQFNAAKQAELADRMVHFRG